MGVLSLKLLSAYISYRNGELRRVLIKSTCNKGAVGQVKSSK